MSITISVDVFCNYCPNWVHGMMGYKPGVRRARRKAKAEGWVRRLSPATGMMVDICPACAKKNWHDLQSDPRPRVDGLLDTGTQIKGSGPVTVVTNVSFTPYDVSRLNSWAESGWRFIRANYQNWDQIHFHFEKEAVPPDPSEEPAYGGIDLHPDAVALRPVKAFKTVEGFRFYEATTFPQWLWGGCETYLRRCKAMGFLKDDDCLIILDVLDENGDVIQDFPLTSAGLRYLRREFGFKAIREA